MATSMEQIHRIKELQMQQKGPYQIAKELGIDPKTVRKYMEQEDFSPSVPRTEIRSSKLDPFKATIDAWLEADKQNRSKQRHTAQRVFNRLTQQFPEFPAHTRRWCGMCGLFGSSSSCAGRGTWSYSGIQVRPRPTLVSVTSC